MKYVQPHGIVDENASYIDGDPSIGQKGSVPRAAAIEHPLREIVHVIDYAGLDSSGTDLEQLRKAIEALIDAKIEILDPPGAPDLSPFLTMAQARARLLFFPHVPVAPYHFGVISPGTGAVRIPLGTTFWHRGVFSYTTVQTDFATDPSKTYHLRCDMTTGVFTLKDVSNVVYNPGALADANPTFDTTYDNMLIARVVTSGLNAVTITNLINLHGLGIGASLLIQTGHGSPSPGSFSQTLNWGRKPKSYSCAISRRLFNEALLTDPSGDFDTSVLSDVQNRYVISGAWLTDWGEVLPAENLGIFIQAEA